MIKAHVRLALIALLAIVMAATIAMAIQTFADDSIHAIKAARPAPPISTAAPKSESGGGEFSWCVVLQCVCD